ncbi:MAG TPA: hypothetical protein VMW91_10985 [Desulfosporosinus sp.]|nr:hypothetical protein [Desulfosporosinus sp.]
MFYHQKHHHAHGFLFILSLLAAFLLGRKSEQYGFTIVSRGCCCSNDENEDEDDDMMNDPNISTPSYPR